MVPMQVLNADAIWQTLPTNPGSFTDLMTGRESHERYNSIFDDTTYQDILVDLFPDPFYNVTASLSANQDSLFTNTVRPSSSQPDLFHQTNWRADSASSLTDVPPL